ncbi:MAG: hypothetical protein ACK4NF_07555, partial [Planctomycetota bacterium]
MRIIIGITMEKLLKLISGFLVYNILIFGQNSGREKTELEQFLDNIKQKLRQIQEVQRKMSNKTLSRKEKEKRKKQIRKKLIVKLALPPVWHKQNFIIHIAKPLSTQKPPAFAQDETTTSALSKSVARNISSLLKQNMALNPFKLPDLKKLLESAMKNSSGAGSPSSSRNPPRQQQQASRELEELKRYEEAVGEYFREIFSKTLWFWETFEKFFVENKESFDYLHNTLCKGEIELHNTRTKQPNSIFLSNFDNKSFTRAVLYKIDNIGQWANISSTYPFFSPLDFYYNRGDIITDYVLYPLAHQ